MDYTTLQPLLGQVFFIGDGLTSTGVTQQVTIPAGATHLVFGTVDYGIWHDNTGGFNVTVGPGTGGTGGGSATLTATTFDVDGYPDNQAPHPRRLLRARPSRSRPHRAALRPQAFSCAYRPLPSPLTATSTILPKARGPT